MSLLLRGVFDGTTRPTSSWGCVVNTAMRSPSSSHPKENSTSSATQSAITRSISQVRPLLQVSVHSPKSPVNTQFGPSCFRVLASEKGARITHASYRQFLMQLTLSICERNLLIALFALHLMVKQSAAMLL